MASLPGQAGDSKGLTEAICSFVVETRSADIPRAALESAKLLILDTIGITLAASTLPIGKIITQYVAEANGLPLATVLGGGLKAAPSMAALANGTMANALDFDGGWHTTTHVVPSALAVVEHQRLSGRDLLDAFVVGVEVGKRLTETFDTSRQVKATRAAKTSGPTARGHWHVGLAGPIATAAVAARLHKLNTAQTAMAIGIATCSAGGFRRNMGTMSKAFHSGSAARHGIEAADLAARGFTADPEVIEAPLGYLQAICHADAADPAPILELLGQSYALAGPLRAKPYPACSRGQQHLDAALRLRRSETFELGDIEIIESDQQHFSLLRPGAADEDAAGFSAAYQISAAMVFGSFGVDQITKEALQDPRVRALMKRFKHVPFSEANKVTLRLKDGRVLSDDILPYRNLENLGDLEPKFRQCAGRVLGSAALEELRDLILGLEEQPNIERIMAIAGAERPAAGEK